MSSRTSTILTIAGVTVLGGALAYAVYFDYKRRNDVEFRKKLRKDKKRADKEKASASTGAAPASLGSRAEELRAALAKIRAEELPASTEAKEQYFMAQASLGEQLCTQGPAFAVPAALAFFRALRVYPSPVELLMLYQQSLPAEVFALIMELTNLDVKDRVEGYFNFFPAKAMNVSVQEKGEQKRKVLVAEKDFEKGDVIYKEEPFVVALDWDLQEQGSHCAHCLRLIHKATAIQSEGDSLGTVYCSKTCQLKSKVQSHVLLFSLDPLLPADIDTGGVIAPAEERKKAQAELVAYLKSKNQNAPLLLARYLARQITMETAKMLPPTDPSASEMPKIMEENSPEYGPGDHLERLRYLDTEVPEEDTKLYCEVFGKALPGLEASLTQDRHSTTLGKLKYNAIGICYSGGRDDKPLAERPEDQERTRTPYGTARQIGSGLYFVSAYLGHSCDPSTRPSFSSGTSELNLIATRPIKKGEELTMAYVDVTQHEGESAEEARRRRRYELARGWRFKCECSKCTEETVQNEETDIGISGDESRVEEVVERVESGQAGSGPAVD